MKQPRDAGTIRRDIRQHEAAIAALESELRQLEAASQPPRSDLASPEAVEAFHRRRRLVDDLAMMRTQVQHNDVVGDLVLDGGLPLMRAQVEAAADLIEGGMEIEAAIAQVTVRNN